MGARSVAVRYARALVAAVREGAELERIQRDLEQFAGMVREHAELRRVLTSPVIPDSQKRRVAEAIFGLVGYHPASRRLLALLAVNGRLPFLDLVRHEIESLHDQRRRIVAAEVVTATPIPENRRKSYHKALEELTGGQVRLKTHVDPAILGGAVTRIGSRVYDGSLKGQLERLHERLRGE